VTDCQENQSLAYSNNRAAEATNAEYLIFLNNDVIFQENVVPELLRSLQDPRSGGPLTFVSSPENSSRES
jgi:GT2 family glycosyltransferase